MSGSAGGWTVEVNVRCSPLRRWIVVVLAYLGLSKLAFKVLEPAIHVSRGEKAKEHRSERLEQQTHAQKV